MAVIGVSLIVASVLWVLVRPPSWLAHLLIAFRAPRPAIDKPGPARRPDKDTPSGAGTTGEDHADDSGASGALGGDQQHADDAVGDAPSIQLHTPTAQADDDDKAARDRAAMPPPPPMLAAPSRSTGGDGPEQTTPKAGPSQPPPRPPVPDFALPPPTAPSLRPPVPSFPAANSPQRASSSSTSAPAPNRLPSLFPAANSPQRASSGLAPSPAPNRGPSLAVPSGRPNPLPNRGPPPSSAPSSSLAPPPTHSTKPAKPSRKVMLAPGHSPLDWASISGPSADLRNLPPSTPFLRVTPSMLKAQNGRRGKDAWMALGGRVYNVSPYAAYHPGGVPELMRTAGRDGSKLFGEVHPWVNYEGMLQACLVGIYVEEGETSSMDDMD